MGLIKYRDTDGTIRELLCLKGEKGDKGDTGSVNNHTHDLTDITCQGYGNAYAFVEDIRGRVDAAESEANTAKQYATDAQEAAQTAQSDAVTAQRKADDALAGVEVANGKTSELTAQMGDIETALDKIIAIQNELIGGDA
jgi:hypothetical protein